MRYCHECGKSLPEPRFLRQLRPCNHLANDGQPIQLRSQYPRLEDFVCGAYFSPSMHPSTIVQSRCVRRKGHKGEHDQRMVQA